MGRDFKFFNNYYCVFFKYQINTWNSLIGLILEHIYVHSLVDTPSHIKE